jgi:hypothetical protein
MLVDEIRPIGDEAAGGDDEASEVYRGQLVPGRQRHDQVAVNCRLRAPSHHQAAIGRAREGGQRALDLIGVAHADRAQLHAER